jgi:hypothetical protein
MTNRALACLPTLLLCALVTVDCGGPTAPSAQRLPQVPPATTPPSPPAALHTLSGVMTEPGGKPIEGVFVASPGGSATTNKDGFYSISELTGLLSVTLTKAGYEDAWPGTNNGYGYFDLSSKDATFNRALQPIIRLAAGDRLDSSVFSDDNGYWDDWEICHPCKLIRVTSTGKGTIELRLTWAPSGATLSLWVGDRYTSTRYQDPSDILATIPTSGGERFVFVGVNGGEPPMTTFVLRTAFRPE